MQLKNTGEQYGIVSKTLHWIIAVLILAELFLVYFKRWALPEKSPVAGFLIGGLHKPIGILILYLGVFFIIWQFLNPHPKFPNRMPVWQKNSAHINHILLYMCMIIIPAAGILMSTAAGYPPNFFKLYQFPQFIEKDQELAGLFFNIHSITGFVLMGVVAIHCLAALKHHFVDRNNILTRMLP